MNVVSIIGSASLCLLLAGGSHADVRSHLAVGPETVYPQMVWAADTGNSDAFVKSLRLLEPLFSEIDDRLQEKTPLSQAMALHDPARMRTFAQETMVRGAIALGKESLQRDDIQWRKSRLRQAFAEYMALESCMQSTDNLLNQQTIAAFRRAHLASPSAHTEFSASVSTLLGTLEKWRVRLRAHA